MQNDQSRHSRNLQYPALWAHSSHSLRDHLTATTRTLYERSEDRLRTYWPAGTVDLLEGCQGVFQTFVDVCFQRLGGNVDVAGKCRFKYLAMFLNCLFATIGQDEHLVT